MQGVFIRFGVDRHGGDTHLMAGPDNPNRDFSPVCN